MPVPADRFDEIRRKWIARHQHTFIFQKDGPKFSPDKFATARKN